MLHLRRLLLLLAAVLLLAPLQKPAFAAEFDETTGRLSASEGSFMWGMDSLPEVLSLQLDGAMNFPLSDEQIADHFHANEEGLEGGGAMSLDSIVRSGSLLLTPLQDRFDGRRVQFNIWQRPEGTRARVELYWAIGDGDAAFFDDDDGAIVYLGRASLLPTGRVTDDGWEEWSSGPIDFNAGGVVGPLTLSMTNEQVRISERSYFSGIRSGHRVLLDAFEVQDLGPAIVEPSICNEDNEAEICGSNALCHMGRCVDAAIVTDVIPAPAQLNDFLDRKIFEFRTFEGGREPQSLMDAFEAQVDLLRDPAPAELWPGLRAAVNTLKDGHASAPSVDYSYYANFGVCVHMGEGDLLPGVPVGPMVFEADQARWDNPIVNTLQSGDMLVEVNGVSIAEWWANPHRFISFVGDPRAFELATANQILGGVVGTGGALKFARCEREVPCNEDEVVYIEIDGSTLGASIWNDEKPDWRSNYTHCDQRFRRLVPEEDNARSYYYAGSSEEDGIRYLLINGVPGDDGWFNGVRAALGDAPPKIILDERTGNGGQIDATDYLASFLMAEDDYDQAMMLPWIEIPSTEEVIGDLRTCVEGSRDGLECGFSIKWTVGESNSERWAANQSKLAILSAFDVSGNDYLTFMLNARSAETRIFGHGSTFGAFGVIFSLPAHLGEVHGGSIQVQDTIFYKNASDSSAPNSGFTTGTGVPPDQVVYQKQSDARLGIDTAIEAARAWLNEPTPDPAP